MRFVLPFVIAGCVLQAVSSQGQAQSRQLIVTPNDTLANALWRIAAATNARIGFEATDHVITPGLIERVPTLSVSTLEGALNAAVGADGRYEWRKLDNVVVVRPKGAWGDRSNPLNRQLRDVHVANATPWSVLMGLRNFIYTDKFAVVQPPAVGPASFDVSSGTVIDVLNELMVAADQVLWIASYRPVGRPSDRFPTWDLSLEARDANHTSSWLGSHPPAQREFRGNLGE